MLKSCNCLMSNYFGEKKCCRKVFRSVTIVSVLLALVTSLVLANALSVCAADTRVPITKEETATNVGRVKVLAQKLYNENNFATQNGGYNYISGNYYPRGSLLTWDSESKSNPKYRSWTYYNGIMMDAFLMMDDTSFRSKVIDFYDANIINGRVDKTKPTSTTYNKNTYAENELDSIPPARALFDLIKSSSVSDARKNNYKNLIYYVYSIVKDFPKADGTNNAIFKHKYYNNNWINYQVGLDGLYMAQPFLMEIANCLDSEDNPLDANVLSVSSADIYTDVYNSMVWVRNNMYNSELGLYHHGWGANPGTNGHYWLRGIGWYAAALADVISMMPDESYRNKLIEIEKELFDGMVKYQNSDTGMWRNVVNCDASVPSASKENKYESSGTALMAYAMMKLYAEGYIDDQYGESGLKAFNGTVINKMTSGDLEDVYRSSGVETTDAGYLNSTYETNEAKGVAPLMMAASYAEEAANKLSTKIDPTVEPPVAKENLVYNGAEQELVTPGTTEDGTFLYALVRKDNRSTGPAAEDYGETVPASKDAGTYEVWYYVKGDERHNDTEPASIEVKIEKKAVIIKAHDQTVALHDSISTKPKNVMVTEPNEEYDDGRPISTEQDDVLIINGFPDHKLVSVTLQSRDTNSSTTDGEILPIDAVIKCGDADVTPNFDITYKRGLLTVEKGMVTIIENPKAAAITYGQNLGDSSLLGGQANDGTVDVPGTFTWEDGSIAPSASDSNTTEYNVIFTPDDDNSYDEKIIQITLEVKKADQSAPEKPGLQAASFTEISLKAVDGYEYSMDGENWQASNVFTGLSMDTEYSFYQRKAGDGNHNASASSPAARFSTAVHIHEWTYQADGSVLTATCSNTDGGHEGQTASNMSIAAPSHKVYGDGLEAAASITGSIAGVQIPEIIYSKGSEKLPSPPTDAGTYTASITVGKATASVSYTIAPKEVTVTAKDQTIQKGESIASGPGQAVLKGALSGHSLSQVSFTVDEVNKKINPSDAVISDDSGNNQTANYTITYKPGALTVKPSQSEDTPDQPSGNLKADEAISVSGLSTGDKVSFYQVLKFDSSAGATGGWVNSAGFTLTDDEIQKILGIGDYAAGKAKADQAGIDEAIAAKIADMAEEAAAKYPDIAEENGTAKQASPETGLYAALISPKNPGDIYNPVFVGADYQRNSSNTWAVTMTDSYQPASMAKKGKVTLEKKASTMEDNHEDQNAGTVAMGDTVSFTVKTKIPEFGSNYTKAVFKITDTLSKGLSLKVDTLKVYAAADAADESKLISAGSSTYTLDARAGDKDTAGSYTISFATAYLLGLDAAQDIFITYDTVVTSEADASVNILDNTVVVNFSKYPTDETGKGTLKDETKHYTFDIDGNLLGEENYKATELVKVAVDKNGNEITETRDLSNGHKVGALQGAEFKLYKAAGCKDTDEYKGNEIFKNGAIIISDEDGRLTVQGQTKPGIRGLDAGTYYLKETKAPPGYISAQDPVKIEIIPTFKTTAKTETVDGIEVNWDYQELEGYIIKIAGTVTANYTMLNEKPNQGDTVVGTDPTSGKIKNTQGIELPSTGGIGTTIFYVLGTILVLGAGILLVTRRRMKTS